MPDHLLQINVNTPVVTVIYNTLGSEIQFNIAFRSNDIFPFIYNLQGWVFIPFPR